MLSREMKLLAAILLGVAMMVGVTTAGNAQDTSQTPVPQAASSQGLQPPSSEAPPLIKQAAGLLDSWHGQGDILEQAKVDIDAVLSKDPQNAFALVELARYYMKSNYLHDKTVGIGHGIDVSISLFQPGTLDMCESILLKAQKNNPKLAKAYEVLGYVYMEEQHLDKAESEYQKANAIEPNSPMLHLNWAGLKRLQGDEKGQMAEDTKVINSGTTDKRILRAVTGFPFKNYMEHKEYDKADALYIKIIGLDPSDAWTIGNYALFLLNDRDDIDKAIEYAKKSLQAMDYGVGHKILAECLYAKWADLIINHKGDDVTAQKLFDSAYMNFPDLNHIMVNEGSYAIRKSLVLALKEKSVSIDARTGTLSNSTALNIAANTGRTDAVEMLLSLGANPNPLTIEGWTPLLGAADEGHEDVVKLLLEHGANVYQTMGWKDAAALADSHGYTKIAQMVRQYVKDHPMPPQEHIPDAVITAIMNSKPSSGITAATDEEKRRFILGAEQGASEAQYGIGDIYEWGKGGVPIDYKQAMIWYLKAADQEDIQAELRIGDLHDLGYGVPHDMNMAIMWYQKAANQGNTDAPKLIEQARQGELVLQRNAALLKSQNNPSAKP